MILLTLALLAATPTLADAFTRLPVRHGETLAPGEGKTVTLDEKNGYLRIVETHPAETSSSTFVVFVTTRKERVYGYRYTRRVGMTDELMVGFFRERAGQLVEATHDVLPLITINDVWPDQFMPRSECNQVDVELPQVGTTIVISSPLMSFCFPGSTEGGNEVQQWWAASEAKARKLTWNAKEGVFVAKK
jgi:hypothetical protein